VDAGAADRPGVRLAATDEMHKVHVKDVQRGRPPNQHTVLRRVHHDAADRLRGHLPYPVHLEMVLVHVHGVGPAVCALLDVVDVRARVTAHDHPPVLREVDHSRDLEGRPDLLAAPAALPPLLQRKGVDELQLLDRVQLQRHVHFGGDQSREGGAEGHGSDHRPLVGGKCLLLNVPLLPPDAYVRLIGRGKDPPRQRH